MSVLSLDEDTIDDILYFTRTSDLSSLEAALSTTSQTLAVLPYYALYLVVDPHTGNTPLHMAAANGHIGMTNPMVALLAQRTQMLWNDSFTDLGIDVLKLLLDLIPNSSGSSQQTSESTISKMIVDRINQSGNTALHWAALNGHLEAAKLLVGAGASLDVKNKAGHGVVFEAAKAEKEVLVTWLLGAAKEKYGREEDVKEEEILEEAGAKGATVTEEMDSGTGDLEKEEVHEDIAKLNLGREDLNMTKPGTEKGGPA